MKRTILTILIGAAICLAAGVGYAQTDKAAGAKDQGGRHCPLTGDKDTPHKKMHAHKRDKGSGWFCPATGRPIMENEPPVCPWCGRPMQRMHGRMMGGMMQNPGMAPCGMGGGRMHGRMGMKPCMRMRYGSGEMPSGPLSAEDAGRLIETHLQNRGNPNLKLRDVETANDHFIATIVTKDDSLVDKVKIDKETGWFRSIY